MSLSLTRPTAPPWGHDVNEALKLYGSGGENSPAYVDTYEVAVKKLKALVEKMRSILPEPTEWAMLEGDD